MHLNYTARSRTGERVTGTIEAEDRTAAIRAIERLGHVPITVTSTGDVQKGSAPSREKPPSPSASGQCRSGLVPSRQRRFRFAVVVASAVILALVAVIGIRHGILRSDRSTDSEQSGASSKTDTGTDGAASAGELVSISGKRIVINYNGADHSFKISKKTQFQVPREALKPGDPVRVWCPSDDEATAHVVDRGYIEVIIPMKF